MKFYFVPFNPQALSYLFFKLFFKLFLLFEIWCFYALVLLKLCNIIIFPSILLYYGPDVGVVQAI